MFDLRTWSLVLIVGGLGAIVHGISRQKYRFSVKLNLFSYFRLIQREDIAQTHFQLGIMVVAALSFGFYETFVPSVAMAPNPPLVYDIVRDLLEHGHKTHQYYPVTDSDNSSHLTARYKVRFEKIGAGHLLNTSFYWMNSPEELYSRHLRHGEVRLVLKNHLWELILSLHQ